MGRDYVPQKTNAVKSSWRLIQKIEPGTEAHDTAMGQLADFAATLHGNSRLRIAKLLLEENRARRRSKTL